MRVCPQCSKSYASGRQFCTHCGVRLIEKEPPAEPRDKLASRPKQPDEIPLPKARPLKERIESGKPSAPGKGEKGKAAGAHAEHAARGAKDPKTREEKVPGLREFRQAESLEAALSPEEAERIARERQEFAWLRLLVERDSRAHGPLAEERDWDAASEGGALSRTVRLYLYPERMCLTVAEEGGKKDGPREVHLFTKPEITLGRQKASVDIVCRLLPVDGATKEATRFIGRRQAAIRLEGESLQLTDLGSSNGTFLDGRQLEPATSIPLVEGATISLARKLDLRLTEERDLAGMLDEMGAKVRSAREEDLRKLFDGLPAEERGRAALLAAKLSRLNNYAGRIDYLLLFREATIGSNPACMIVVEGEGIHPVHAKLLHLEGNLALVDLGSRAGTSVNGRPIPPYVPTTLPPKGEISIAGRVLTLGEAVIEG